MTASDQYKLTQAGFMIIRKGNSTIKAKTKERPEWHTLQKDLKSQAAIDRAAKELLKSPLVVED
jgi:hypothetical protein